MSAPRNVRDPDAVLLADDDNELDLDLTDGPRNANPYATRTRWRHEESSQFRKHAGQTLQPRAAEAKTGTHDLADFLNSTRVAPDATAAAGSSRPGSAAPAVKHTPIMVDGNTAAAAGEPNLDVEPALSVPQDGKTIACGPLLNYRRMEGIEWIGSVLIVTKGGGKTQPFVPTLVLRRVGEAQHTHANGTANATTNGDATSDGSSSTTQVQGCCLYSDYRNTFWRFDLHCPMEPNEIKWEYTVPGMRFVSKNKPQKNSFYVPALTESMRSTCLF